MKKHYSLISRQALLIAIGLLTVTSACGILNGDPTPTPSAGIDFPMTIDGISFIITNIEIETDADKKNTLIPVRVHKGLLIVNGQVLSGDADDISGWDVSIWHLTPIYTVTPSMRTDAETGEGLFTWYFDVPLGFIAHPSVTREFWLKLPNGEFINLAPLHPQNIVKSKPTPTSCAGMDYVIEGMVYVDSADSINILSGVPVRLSQTSWCSPTAGEHIIHTAEDGSFEFNIYIHDTDTLDFLVDIEGYRSASVRRKGLDYLAADRLPVELVLQPIE